MLAEHDSRTVWPRDPWWSQAQQQAPCGIEARPKWGSVERCGISWVSPVGFDHLSLLDIGPVDIYLSVRPSICPSITQLWAIPEERNVNRREEEKRLRHTQKQCSDVLKIETQAEQLMNTDHCSGRQIQCHQSSSPWLFYLLQRTHSRELLLQLLEITILVLVAWLQTVACKSTSPAHGVCMYICTHFLKKLHWSLKS